MDGTTYLEFLKIALICLLWYLSSASDSIIGKVVLSDFPYPMTLTMAQLLTTSLFLGPFLPCLGAKKKGEYDRRYLFTMILPLAFGKFLSSVSSYISIWKVSVSYAHTVKATLPLFTLAWSKLIFGENHTPPHIRYWVTFRSKVAFTYDNTVQVYFSLLPIITGVGVATMTEASFDSVGLASALTSTVCFSLLTIFTKKCLKDTGYHHLQLLILVSRIATACFVPFWVIADLWRIIHDSEFLHSGRILQTLMLLFCNGVLNMMHSTFAFTVLALVTPLSYAVANATKRIVIIGGSILILQNTVSPLNGLGMLIAVFGVLCYNKAKYDESQAARREKVLPLVHSDPKFYGHGVQHLAHSKSDANFLGSGLSNGTGASANGHILLQEWQQSDEGLVLLPVASRSFPERHLRSSDIKHIHEPSVHLHSRNIYNV